MIGAKRGRAMGTNYVAYWKTLPYKLMVGLKWIGFGVLTGILVGGVSAGDGLPPGADLDRVSAAACGSVHRLGLSSSRGTETAGDEPRAGGHPRE